jgi:hypothetical protein
MPDRPRLDVAIERVVELVLELVLRKEEVECDLVASLMGNSARGKSEIRRLGLTVDRFERMDMRILFSGIEVAGHLGKETVAQLASQALRAEYLWEEKSPVYERFVSHSTWCTTSLSAFCCSDYAPTRAPKLAKELIDLDTRLHRARQLWIDLLDTLDLSQEKDQVKPELIILPANNPTSRKDTPCFNSPPK